MGFYPLVFNKSQKIINNCLRLDWLPEQVCGWLDANNIIKLHHESIYHYLLKNKASGGLLYKHLRHQGKPYRKRYGHPNSISLPMPKYFTIIHSITALVNINTVGNACTVIRMAITLAIRLSQPY